MSEPIPLRARLGVNLDNIVKSNDASVLKAGDIMLHGKATKAWIIQMAHRPIQLDMSSSLDLVGSIFDHIFGQKIQCYEEEQRLDRGQFK